MNEQRSEIPFEARIKELDEILRKLESGNIPLEEAIRNYERGVALLKDSYKMLDELEGRIVKLVRSSDGSIVEQPLEIGSENEL